MAGARNFREYSVWKEAVSFATCVYEVTGKLPWFEKKGLCDQLQRAAVSISSNIAEGAARTSDADLAAPTSVATRHSPNTFGLCSRCSIGSHTFSTLH